MTRAPVAANPPSASGHSEQAAILLQAVYLNALPALPAAFPVRTNVALEVAWPDGFVLYDRSPPAVPPASEERARTSGLLATIGSGLDRSRSARCRLYGTGPLVARSAPLHATIDNANLARRGYQSPVVANSPALLLAVAAAPPSLVPGWQPMGSPLMSSAGGLGPAFSCAQRHTKGGPGL